MVSGSNVSIVVFPFLKPCCNIYNIPVYLHLFVLAGIKHEWQLNGLDDIKDRRSLAEKLGGTSVVSLEGKALSE